MHIYMGVHVSAWGTIITSLDDESHLQILHLLLILRCAKFQTRCRVRQGARHAGCIRVHGGTWGCLEVHGASAAGDI